MNFGIYTVLPSYGPQTLSGQIVHAHLVKMLIICE